jgi:hypothetical protein
MKMQALYSVRYRYVLLLLSALVMADGVITEFIINSGRGWESNPFMSGLLPTGWFLPVKMAGSLLVVLIMASVYRQQPKMAVVASWIFVAVYTGIVYWNICGTLLAAPL